MAINGQGDVLGSDGKDCYVEYNGQCKEAFTEDCSKTFTANPRDGHRFVGLDYCQSAQGNVCGLDVTDVMVKEGFFKELPSITSNFAPADTSSFDVILDRGGIMHFYTSNYDNGSVAFGWYCNNAECLDSNGGQPDHDQITGIGWVMTAITTHGQGNEVAYMAIRDGNRISSTYSATRYGWITMSPSFTGKIQ